MKFVNCFECRRISRIYLTIGAARAKDAIACDAHAGSGRIGRCRCRLDYDAILLLVTYGELSKNAQAFYIEIIDELIVAADEEALLLIEEQTLKIFERYFSKKRKKQKQE